MKTTRIILSGSLVWLLIFSAFVGLSFVPAVTGAPLAQWLIVGVLIIPFAAWGTAIYYRKGAKTNGLVTALVMVTTALILDAVITVPFIEIPYNNSSYTRFFTNSLLWVLVAENMAVIYAYWRIKVKPKAYLSIS